METPIRIVSFGDKYKVDHGAVEGEKQTLCGRQLVGMEWFYRGNDPFKGNRAFYCKGCCRAFKKIPVPKTPN